jgi:hypothetical protein
MPTFPHSSPLGWSTDTARLRSMLQAPAGALLQAPIPLARDPLPQCRPPELGQCCTEHKLSCCLRGGDQGPRGPAELLFVMA